MSETFIVELTKTIQVKQQVIQVVLLAGMYYE